jgi:hypothetical protein
MRTAILILSTSALCFLQCMAADTDKPPENIVKHYEWCASAKDVAGLIARYEGFWEQRHPKDEEY